MTALRSVQAGFCVELADTGIEAGQVVVATGPFQIPRTPELAAALDGSVTQLHSADYRSPAQLPAVRCSWSVAATPATRSPRSWPATHDVHLSVGSRQAPLPQRVLGVDLFRILDRIGPMRKTVHSRLGRQIRTARC